MILPIITQENRILQPLTNWCFLQCCRKTEAGIVLHLFVEDMHRSEMKHPAKTRDPARGQAVSPAHGSCRHIFISRPDAGLLKTCLKTGSRVTPVFYAAFPALADLPSLCVYRELSLSGCFISFPVQMTRPFKMTFPTSYRYSFRLFFIPFVLFFFIFARFPVP